MYTTATKVNALVTTTLPVDDYIEEVSRFIDNEIGYKLGFIFGSATKDLYFDGSGTNDTFLGLSILKDHGDIEMDGIIIEPVEYPLNEEYTNWLKYKFTGGNGNLKINDAKVGRYVIDWATPANHTLPADITRACTALVVSLIKKDEAKKQNSGIVASETIGSYAISFDTTDKPESSIMQALNIINNYKAINIA